MEVVATAVSGVALGVKYVVGHWRKTRIVVLASRARGVAGGAGFVDEWQSFAMLAQQEIPPAFQPGL